MAIQRNDEEVAYSFFKYNDTEETHIFTGHFTPETCTAKAVSICEKLNRKEENISQIKICLNEDQARAKAAELGRSVCGTCVSHLYTTY